MAFLNRPGHRDDLRSSPGENLASGARHADDARRHLIRAMHHLDEVGGGKVWQHLALAVTALDDARSILTERAPDASSGRRH